MKKTILFYLFSLLTIVAINAQVLENGNFEMWSQSTIGDFEDPDGWVTSNVSGVPAGLLANVTKTTDAQNGSFAMKLETIDDPDTEPYTGGAVLHTTISGKPMKITGYYKATINGNNVAALAIILQSNGIAIGVGDIEFTNSQNDYTYFEVDIEYFMNNLDPDFFTLTILSSANNSTLGSSLIIDNLTFDGITSMKNESINKVDVEVIPNPATNSLRFALNEYNQEVNLTILDGQGKLVFNGNFQSQKQLDVSSYQSGQYIFHLKSKDGTLLTSDRFIIAK
jgi:hypothetical protein